MENNQKKTSDASLSHSHKWSKLETWYNAHYKNLLIISAIFFILSAIYMFSFYQQNGDFIYKDVSLTGGTTITVYDQNTDLEDLRNALKTEFPDISTRGISDIRTGRQEGFFIETKSSPESITPALEKYLGYKLDLKNSSTEFSGSSLSEGFYSQLRLAILIAFVLMALVVFAIFRAPIRSLSIIIAVAGDILMTLCVVNLLGMEMSTAGIVALLMLIGYSVDVDILLTTRVFKDKEGNLNHRIFGAFKTGITMTLTAIAAIATALAFTHSFSSILSQMFIVLLIGLGFDIFNCWVTNASLLKWYMEAHKLE